MTSRMVLVVAVFMGAAVVEAHPAGARQPAAATVLQADDFRRAFRGAWAPPSGGERDGFAGSYATHEQARNGRTVYLKGHQNQPCRYGKPEVTAADGKQYVDHQKTSKGYHAEGYSQGFWVYDPAEVREAYHGTRKPSDVQPVEWIDLRDLGATLDGADQQGWVTASYRDGRLIVGVQSGVPGSEGAGLPVMFEFRWPK